MRMPARGAVVPGHCLPRDGDFAMPLSRSLQTPTNSAEPGRVIELLTRGPSRTPAYAGRSAGRPTGIAGPRVICSHAFQKSVLSTAMS